MSDMLDFYENQTKSLREFLIPLGAYVAQVKKFEDSQFDHLRVDYHLDAKANWSMYVVPYPFQKSVLQMIFERKRASGDTSDTLTDEDRDLWTRLIEHRNRRIIEHRIMEEDLAFLDSNSDIGVFLNMRDGAISPFQYSALSGIDVVSISIKTQSQLLHYKPQAFHGTLQEYGELEKYFHRNISGWTTWANFRYDDPTGDLWHTDNESLYLINDIPHTEEYRHSMEDYIHVAIGAHKKVITYT